MSEIEGEDDFWLAGEVPTEWIENRIIGVTTSEGEYADICSSEWIRTLGRKLAPHLKQFGVRDLDASVLQQTAPRAVTQLVSRILFQNGSTGIYYRSMWGHDIENWALFDPFRISIQDSESIRSNASELLKGLKLHSL